jgi:hypothetical protein
MVELVDLKQSLAEGPLVKTGSSFREKLAAHLSETRQLLIHFNVKTKRKRTQIRFCRVFFFETPNA